MLKTYRGSCHCGAVRYRGRYRPRGGNRPMQLLDLYEDALGRADQAGCIPAAGGRGRAQRLPVQHRERPPPVLQDLRRAAIRPRLRRADRRRVRFDPDRHTRRRNAGRACRRAGQILKRPRQCLVERAGGDTAPVRTALRRQGRSIALRQRVSTTCVTCAPGICSAQR